MYRVHCFLDNVMVIRKRMEHIPRSGETMRFESDKIGIVAEIVWCMDEPEADYQRINIRVLTEK